MRKWLVIALLITTQLVPLPQYLIEGTQVMGVGLVFLLGLFIFVAMRFLRTQQAIDARRLFLISIAYLPLLLGALVLTKI